MAYTTLRKGSKGSEVTKLQKALIEAGYDVGSTGADGSYGAKTQAAVKAYQKENGLVVDGIAGKNTLGSLYSSKTTTNNNKNVVDTNNVVKSPIAGMGDENYNIGFNNPWDANNNKDLVGQMDKVNSSLGRLEELTSVTDIIDQATMDRLNERFQVSDAYNQAMEYTNQLLAQLSTGRTSYTDQIKDMMNKIQNREDFEYDVDQDQLFQQALASAMNSGQSAMQDTIGQASALTGGYGSTYATSAGNQAYNAFIEDAYNNLPEYYQMAMEAYQMEGQEMYNQLGMLQAADESEWNKMYTSWDANFKNAQNIWNQDFSTWEAGVNQAYNSAQVQLSEYNTLLDAASQMYSANMDMYETMYKSEWDSWNSLVTQAQEAGKLEVSNHWSQKDLDYKYDSLAEQKRQYNYSIGDTNNDGKLSAEEIKERDKWKQAEYDLNSNQYILSTGDANMDGVLSDEEKLASGNYINNADGKIVPVNYDGWIDPDKVEVDGNGNIIGIEGYELGNTDNGAKPSVSGFKTGSGNNFEITIGGNSYKVQNGWKVTSQQSKDNLNNPKKTKVYGNLYLYNGDELYIKSGNDYYRVEGRATNKSGYNDLVMALQNQ